MNDRSPTASTWLLRLGLVLVGLELGSLVASAFSSGVAWYSAAQARRDQLVSSPTAGLDPAERIHTRLAGEPLHPYVGFVNDPALNTPENVEVWRGLAINEYGFPGPLMVEPSDDRLVVAMTGGSVAFFFSILARDDLIDAIRRVPEHADKEIVFVALNLQGHKQPQQLFALQYALVAGAHFDWVLNLDGFNEVALPAVENRVNGTAALFPRRWHMRVAGRLDPVVSEAAATVAYLERLRVERAEDFSGALRFSLTANFLWSLLDLSYARRIGELEEAASTRSADAGSFAARGPLREFADDAAFYGYAAEIWQRSSLQMHRLCEANGIRYVHFLQPNQYVPDSKPMEAVERARAVSEESRFRDPVLTGYPLLRSRGAELLAAGVEFHDLTQVFASVQEPLYIDNCCHFNEVGNELLAATMAALLAE